MLEKCSEHILFGTKILLLGCRHENTHKFEQKITEFELYKAIDSFSPQIILVELGDFYQVEWVTHKTDIKAIIQYLSNESMDYKNHIHKYDLEKNEYDHEQRGPSEEIQNTIEYRKNSRRKTPEHFEQVLQIREENASIELMEFLRDYDRVVMHCGSNHYPVYEEHIKFLKSEF